MSWNESLASSLFSTWTDKKNEGKKHWNLICVAADLVEGETVFDVGCGFCQLYERLKQLNKQVKYFGVDSNTSMLSRAHLLFPEVNIEQADVYDLKRFQNHDSVVAVGLLLHLDDPETALKQLWSRVNKVLIFTVWLGVKEASCKICGITHRRDTETSLNKIFSILENVEQVEKHPFRNPTDAESNCFFKLRRKP